MIGKDAKDTDKNFIMVMINENAKRQMDNLGGYIIEEVKEKQKDGKKGRKKLTRGTARKERKTQKKRKAETKQGITKNRR